MDNFQELQNKYVLQINNSNKANKMPHAMLIEGASDLMLEQAVNYVVASLLCEKDTPCFECETCQRVLSKTISDVIEFDLSDEALKKENVLEIQQRFSKTALESTNKQIYVIKYIENASSIALNSLLKFLEEPNENVYAIFTTQNFSRVLETIVSRTINFRLVKNDIKYIKEILSQSYRESDIDLVLSITTDEVFVQKILDGEVFITFKENANKIFRNIYSGNFFVIMFELLNDLEKEDLKIFFELFYTCLTRQENLKKLNVEPDVIEQVEQAEHLEEALDTVLSARLQLDTNMNKALIVDKFSVEIEGLMQ